METIAEYGAFLIIYGGSISMNPLQCLQGLFPQAGQRGSSAGNQTLASRPMSLLSCSGNHLLRQELTHAGYSGAKTLSGLSCLLALLFFPAASLSYHVSLSQALTSQQHLSPASSGRSE